jgi:two-component system sensor histidine kinase PilS (NtrC family)
MFNPFFTTSASGTGLGLYIALELATTNGIALEYRAMPGGGNSFHLSLPPAA